MRVSRTISIPETKTATAPLVSVRNVDFAYSDRLVLKHIDLDVERGKTLGLIGANGGGKTTLIRLLVGLLKPTRGQITIDGLLVQQAARRGDVIGYLPQRLELNRDMPVSARQLIGLCGGSRSPAQAGEDLLACVGLADLAERPIGALSGGQFQRLLIARALASSPQLLVLDEPTTGIDSESREQFVELLQRLKKQLRLTIIMSSHDLHTVHRLSDDVACLNLTLHLHHKGVGATTPANDYCNLSRPDES